MVNFDPNAAALVDSGIFGLPCSEVESKLIYIPVPWEVTTSYGGGTSQGPKAIIEASKQVDLYDFEVEMPYQAGLFVQDEDIEIRKWNLSGKTHASKIIAASGVIQGNPELTQSLATVNELGHRLNERVHELTKSILAQGKIPAVIGGDHSVPFGALQAVAEKTQGFGVLHFDAHLDTRHAYEGFTWSHASIMYNVLELIPQVKKLVQVGIRDFCEEEVLYCKAQEQRVRTYFDAELARRKFEGVTFKKTAEEIVSQLPKEVWVSFDIDGLDPRFCPNTGTPVPGGLDFNEASYILKLLVLSGRKIIGFDINEVSPGQDAENPSEWDANVGARLLYRMSGLCLASQGFAKLRA